ncbi:MAG: hypothetical protein IKE58_05010 [Blautia sp.]|nr:hypothetical protein [Blautia sp.]
MKLEDQPRRFCRRCLLREMETDNYQTLKTYIRNLDEDLKVSDLVYEERLARCRKCQNLISGLCRICGCFVELRAVMKKNSCPMVHPAWERAEETDSQG